MTQYHQLIQYTKQLIAYNNEAMEYYSKGRQAGEEADFYEVVKPFADEVKVVIDQWKQHSLSWVNEVKPKYIHQAQIEQTAENIERLSINCFFPSSSLNKMKSHHQSTDYILNRVLTLLNVNS